MECFHTPVSVKLITEFDPNKIIGPGEIKKEAIDENAYKSTNLFKALCDEITDIVVEDDEQPTQEQIEQAQQQAEQAKKDEEARIAAIENSPYTQAIDRNVTNAINERETQNAAYQAARNQGLTAAEAQALKGQSENSTRGNATNIGTALRSTGQSTQNDWLEKQGYANALGMQANNLQNGAFLNTLGAIFGGAGTGASVGASIGGGGK